MNRKLCEHPFLALLFQHERTRLRIEGHMEDDHVVFPLGDDGWPSSDQYGIIQQFLGVSKSLAE